MKRSRGRGGSCEKPVIAHPEADLDSVSSAKWYDQQRSGLGDDFLVAVNEAYYAIEEDPDTGILVEYGFRMKTLGHFPFGVVFREHRSAIYVVAVHHFRRDTRYWIRRDQDFEETH